MCGLLDSGAAFYNVLPGRSGLLFLLVVVVTLGDLDGLTIGAYTLQRTCKDMQFAGLELLDGGINGLLGALGGDGGVQRRQIYGAVAIALTCLLYTSPSPRD